MAEILGLLQSRMGHRSKDGYGLSQTVRNGDGTRNTVACKGDKKPVSTVSASTIGGYDYSPHCPPGGALGLRRKPDQVIFFGKMF